MEIKDRLEKLQKERENALDKSKEEWDKASSMEAEQKKIIEDMIAEALWCIMHSIPKSLKGELWRAIKDNSTMEKLYNLASGKYTGRQWRQEAIEMAIRDVRDKAVSDASKYIDEHFIEHVGEGKIDVILPTDDKIVVLVDGEVLGWYNPDTGKITAIR